MNCLDATPNQKNGEMVCCLWSWRIKTSASKNIRKLTFISGVFWMVMLILNGLNLWTLSWMIIKCSHLCLTIVFLWHLQWDFCLKFQISEMQPRLQYLEVVFFSSTRLILVGNPLSTVGSIDLSLTWKQTTTEFHCLSLQSTTSLRLYSSAASNPTSKHPQIWWIKLKLLILLLLPQWASFKPSAQFSMVSSSTMTNKSLACTGPNKWKKF